MKTLKQVNYIFNTKQKFQFLLIFVLIWVGALLELLGVGAILPLITVVLDPDIIHKNKYCILVADIFHIETAGEFVILISMGLCIVYIVKNIFLIISKNIQLAYSSEMQQSISVRLMDFYLNQNYLYHVSHNVAELQRNVGGDVGRFFATINLAVNLLVECLTSFLLVITLCVIDFMTTIVIVGILLVAVVTFFVIYKKLQVQYGVTVRRTGAEQGKWLLQSFAGIKEIKVMNKESFFLNNYKRALHESNRATKNATLLSAVPKNIMETICICSLLTATSIRIMQGVELEQMVVTLSAFALAAIRMLPSFNRITEYLGKILFNKASVENVFKDLKEAEKLGTEKKEKETDIAKLKLGREITVQDLEFVYPKTDKKIFDKASISIKKNKSVAFVGSSGAGKTTLADIIIGLLEPKAGKVLVDGTDIFSHLDEWHETIGYIPQMIYLMDDTICANIVFGVSQDEVNEEQVWEALERAELAEFVRGLPDGIYTKIGDRGVRLSGGQRQRIGIARALYREPEVLILDEATSALDNETETAVMESIENLHGKTTLIIIAHRLTTIRNCDEVYEVGDGKISLKEKEE